MARDLFSEISTPSMRFRSSSRWTILLSVAAHVAIVAVVLIIPLMATDVLPVPDTGTLNFIAAVTPPPAPPAPRLASAPTATPTVPINPNVAPINPPDTIQDEVVPAGVPVADGGVDPGSSVTNGVPYGVSGIGATVEVPAPPPPAMPQKPLRIGGAVRAPVKIANVSAIYPPIAQRARIAGTVTIDAVIDTDGAVRDARVLSGVPLLNQAALDAVRQWRYTPTLLNGVPVQVVMTVKVEFRLN
jgi:protein TonB